MSRTDKVFCISSIVTACTLMFSAPLWVCIPCWTVFLISTFLICREG
jgi:hypothetical protein